MTNSIYSERGLGHALLRKQWLHRLTPKPTPEVLPRETQKTAVTTTTEVLFSAMRTSVYATAYKGFSDLSVHTSSPG